MSTWAGPTVLRCVACRYELNGLTVVGAIIECPECGHGQVVLAYNPALLADTVEQAGSGGPFATPSNRLFGCVVVALALIGGVVVVLVLAAVVLSAV